MNKYPVALDIDETIKIEVIKTKRNQKLVMKLKYPCYVFDANHNLKKIITEKVIDYSQCRKKFEVRL